MIGSDGGVTHILSKSGCLRTFPSVSLLAGFAQEECPVVWTHPTRTPRFPSEWDLRHVDKPGLGRHCVAGMSTGACGARADPDGEGMWGVVASPLVRTRADASFCPEGLPATAFRFLRSHPSGPGRARCPSQTLPPRSPHTRHTQPVPAADSNSLPGRRPPLADRRREASVQASPAQRRAGREGEQQTRGTQATPLPVGLGS